MERRGIAGHRDRPSREEGLGGDVAATGRADRLPDGQRAVPRSHRLVGAQHRQRRSGRGVSDLGLADPVPTQRGDGGDRPVRPCAAGRDTGVRPCRRSRGTGQIAAGRGVPEQLAATDRRNLRHAGHLHAVLHRHDVGAELRHRQAPAGGQGARLRLRVLLEMAVDRGAVLRRAAAGGRPAGRPLRPP